MIMYVMEMITLSCSVVAIVCTETPKHPIAPLVTYKQISVRDEVLTHLGKVNLAYIQDIRKIRVLDNTGSVSLTLFDRIANALLNKKAKELVEKQLKICQEADVIEELELKVPTLEDSASETEDTSSLIESLKHTGTSPIKRKLEDVIDVEELSNASTTKKKPLAPKIEKD
nr:hypothetical protein [Tanacetum cinerariifolium]